MWIAYAKRPLTLEALRDAVAMEANIEDVKMLTSKIPPVELILDACSNLVMLDSTNLEYGSYISWRQTIRFVHFSVQEYILNDSIDDCSTLSILNIKPDVANAEISQLCMVFIMFCWVHKDPSRAYPGLCRYAYNYWDQHTRTLPYINNELMTTIHNFFKSSLFFTLKTFNRNTEFNCHYIFERDPHTQFSPVLLALIFDLPLVSIYLEKNHDISYYPDDQYAIHCAVRKGSCEAVR